MNNKKIEDVCVDLCRLLESSQWLRSAGKAALQLCKIRESDWSMLLDSVKIKSIHQSGSRILQQLQSSFFC